MVRLRFSRPERRSVSRCRSVVGWVSARHACCHWNQGTSATSGPETSTAKATESTHASPRPPEIAPSKSRGDMAITNLKQYAHLTTEDTEELARELDAIRTDIEESRGERDARYIRRSIQLQRAMAAGGRIG